MEPKIVFLVGKIGAGKTTAAKVFKELGYHHMSFAEPLRAMIGGFLGPGHPALARDADKNAPLEEFGGKSIRFAMLTLGTEWGREMMSHDLWIAHMHRRIVQYAQICADYTNECKIVIDDARFPNEIELLKGHGAWGMFVDRPKVAHISHISEGLADDFAQHADYVLKNEGTLEEFERTVEETAQQLG